MSLPGSPLSPAPVSGSWSPPELSSLRHGLEKLLRRREEGFTKAKEDFTLHIRHCSESICNQVHSSRLRKGHSGRGKVLTLATQARLPSEYPLSYPHPTLAWSLSLFPREGQSLQGERGPLEGDR